MDDQVYSPLSMNLLSGTQVSQPISHHGAQPTLNPGTQVLQSSIHQGAQLTTSHSRQPTTHCMSQASVPSVHATQPTTCHGTQLPVSHITTTQHGIPVSHITTQYGAPVAVSHITTTQHGAPVSHISSQDGTSSLHDSQISHLTSHHNSQVPLPTIHNSQISQSIVHHNSHVIHSPTHHNITQHLAHQGPQVPQITTHSGPPITQSVIQGDHVPSQVSQPESTIQGVPPKIQKAQVTVQGLQSAIQVTQRTIQQTQSTVQQTQSTVQLTPTTIQLTQTIAKQTQPTIHQTQPTVHINDVTQATVQDTQPTVQQTQPMVQQTESTVQQTYSAIQQTQSAVQQTQSTVQVTQPTIEGMQSTVQVTQPTIERVQSTIQQTQSTVEGVQSTVQPTQPVLENEAPINLQAADQDMIETQLKAEIEEQIQDNVASDTELQMDEGDPQVEEESLAEEGSEENGRELSSEKRRVTRKKTRHSRARVKKMERAKRSLTLTEAEMSTAFTFMRKRRKDLTLGTKIKVLEMLEQEPKVAQGKIASMFHVSQSQVSRIMKNKEAIMSQWNRFATPDRKRCRHGKAGALEQKLVDWYKEAEKDDLPISGPILMEKAKLIGNEMGIEFKPSAGWLARWKDRNGVVLKRFKDKDGVQSATKVGNHWRRYTFTKATKEYSPENVWVVDETALTYGAAPDYLSQQTPDSSKQVSVVLACNLAGTERRPALVVGQTQILSSLTLPVLFHHHPKAAVTLDIFSLWLKEWDRELRTKRKKIVLLMKRAPLPPENPHLFNIHITFFPPDTRTVLQPFQLGITNTFKSLYRYQQLKFMMAKTHANEQMSHSNMFNHSTLSLPPISPCVSPLDVVFMVYKAWKHVSPETIVKGVVKAGLSKDVDTLKVIDVVTPPPGIPQQDFEALIMLDQESCVGEEEGAPQEQAVSNQNGEVPNIQYPNYQNLYNNSSNKTNQINQQIEDPRTSLPASPSVSEAVHACQVLREYLQQRGGYLFDEFSELESSIHLDMILENRPDFRNDLQPDPLHDSGSVHSLEAHNVALDKKVEYTKKSHEEVRQQRLQKELKKVIQISTVSQNQQEPLSTSSQENDRGILHSQLVGRQRSDVPTQEIPREDITRHTLHQQIPRINVVRQSSIVQSEYQDRSRGSLVNVRGGNMSSYRNELGSSESKLDSIGPGGEIRSLGNQHGSGVNIIHNIRQPDSRLENHPIPYYNMSNTVHHYMQPK